MSIIRWAFTVLAFPLGGLAASQLVGPADNPLRAAAAAAIVGTLVGGAQALALGRRGGWRWLVATIAGIVVGAIVSVLVTAGATTVVALVATGLITGVLIGIAQALVLRRSWRVAGIWTATVSLSWGLGWLITANVIVDAEKGFAVFGASGALVVTAITATVLRLILGPRAKRAPKALDETLVATPAVAATPAESMVEAGR